MQPLDPDTCYRALVSRDARFDGRFFATVKTTGIYCRPICPAPKPRRKNVDFVTCAAAAEAAGFRACLRCRPDAAPGSPEWAGRSTLLKRALRRVYEGALDSGTVEDLGRCVGVGARHLTRLFREELGATPLDFARTLRAHSAWRWIEQTELPMTDVAFAAGYGSVRSFNAEVRARFGASPAELRKRARKGVKVAGDGLRLRLTYRAPLPWDATLDYLAARAIPGVECVQQGRYRRTVRVEGRAGTIDVGHAQTANALEFSTDLPVSRSFPGLVERVRTLFDLRADPQQIAQHLLRAPELSPWVERFPGLRVLGAWDGFELAVRAVLGQQVSLKGATTLLGRLAELAGDPLPSCQESLTRLFPTPGQVLAADLSTLGVPGARATALRALAGAVVAGDLDLDPGADPERTRATLLALPGIGPWTADYVLMRGLRDPDAFPAGDLVLRKALAKQGETITARELEQRSEAWRPWRSYAAIWLWKSMTERA